MVFSPKKQPQSPQNYDYYQGVSLWTQCVAEFMGTYIMILIGCGAECVQRYQQQTSHQSYPVSFLWVVGATLGIYSAASISGGHLNPAVTLSFAATRPAAFPRKRVIPFLLAQLAGAFVAGSTNLLLFSQTINNYELGSSNDMESLRLNCNKKGGDVCSAYELLYWDTKTPFANSWSFNSSISSLYHAIFVEAFGTAFVVFVIFIMTSPLYPIPSPAVPPIAALAIGAMMMILGGLTGPSLNPAREVGVRLAAKAWQWHDMTVLSDILPFTLGPMIGGPIGALCAEFFLKLT